MSVARDYTKRQIVAVLGTNEPMTLGAIAHEICPIYGACIRPLVRDLLEEGKIYVGESYGVRVYSAYPFK